MKQVQLGRTVLRTQPTRPPIRGGSPPRAKPAEWDIYMSGNHKTNRIASEGFNLATVTNISALSLTLLLCTRSRLYWAKAESSLTCCLRCEQRESRRVAQGLHLTIKKGGESAEGGGGGGRGGLACYCGDSESTKWMITRL